MLSTLSFQVTSDSINNHVSNYLRDYKESWTFFFNFRRSNSRDYNVSHIFVSFLFFHHDWSTKSKRTATFFFPMTSVFRLNEYKFNCTWHIHLVRGNHNICLIWSFKATWSGFVPWANELQFWSSNVNSYHIILITAGKSISLAVQHMTISAASLIISLASQLTNLSSYHCI